MTFEEALAGWLPGQRWFAGKGAPIDRLAIVADTVLVEGDPSLRHLVVAVSQAGGTDRYQLLAGLRTAIPDRLEHAVIGPAGDAGEPGQAWTAYDALHDPQLTRRLLQAMAGQETIGQLSFAAEPDAAIDAGLNSLVLTGEQSNTSMIFGEEAILKVFRRPHPGPNPDLEIPRALHRAGSPHVAPPLGWMQTTLDGTPTVLAILSAYLRGATDGWLLAATSVRDLYASDAIGAAEAGGDFAAEAHRLGEATAEVHRALAEAFGTAELPTSAYRDLAAQMRDRLNAAVAAVPELARHAGRCVRRAGRHRRAAGGPADPRRLPPRAGDSHPGRMGTAGLRGRARGAAGPAARPGTGAARRGGHAALARLRRPAPAARPRRPGARPRGRPRLGEPQPGGVLRRVRPGGRHRPRQARHPAACPDPGQGGV